MSWVTVGVYPASQGRQSVWAGGCRLGHITYATWEHVDDRSSVVCARASPCATPLKRLGPPPTT